MRRSLDMGLLAIVIVSYISVVNAVCPMQTWNTTGVFTLPPGNATEGDSCIFNITRPASLGSFTTLTLSNIVMGMGNNDTLVIYDGGKKDGNMLMSINKETVVSQIAISFSPLTIIEYNVTTNNTKSSGTVNLDLEVCSHNLTDTWTLPVNTPWYLPGQGNFSCTYTVAASLPADRVAVVSFSEYSLQAESYVAFTSGDKQDNTTLVQRDFFTDPSANETTVEFVVVNNTSPQSVSLVFDNDITSCTEDLIITDLTPLNWTLPEEPGADYRCHLRVRSDNNTLMLRVNHAELVTGLDSLTVLDGPTSESALVTHISESTCDYLVLSTGSYLTLHLSLHNRRAARRLELTFTPVSGSSHRLSDNGTLCLEGTPGNNLLTSDPVTSDPVTSDPVTSYWQLAATEGSVVQVSLNTTLTGNATLTYYDGLQKDENKIVAVLTAKSQDLTVVVGGAAAMLVVLAEFPAGDNFTASFDSVKMNCDQTLTSPSGQLQYVELAGDDTDHCTWTLAPMAGQGVLVLTPQLLSLGQGDNITVYSGLSGDLVLATFTSDLGLGPLPQLNVLAADGARVVIHDADTGESDMKISINYRVEKQVCGGMLSPSGVLTTPNFPNQYPVNSACQWAASDAKQLLLSVDTVNLAPGHYLSVISEGKEMVSYDSNTTVLPPDFITDTNNTLVKFSAPVGSTAGVSQGAKVKYWVLDCGGLVNNTNGVLESPSTNKSALCVWVIKLPSDEGTRVIDFNVTVNGTHRQADVGACLQIYNGASLRSPQLLQAANISHRTRHLSRYDTIIVVYNHTVLHNTSSLGFNLTFTTYKCNETCNNDVCMHPDWRCNGVNDCGDFSDETNCTAPPSPAPPKPAPAADYSGWVKSGWIPASLFIGMALGAVLLIIIPRIYRRMRGGGGNYSRMSDHTPVVA